MATVWRNIVPSTAELRGAAINESGEWGGLAPLAGEARALALTDSRQGEEPCRRLN